MMLSTRGEPLGCLHARRKRAIRLDEPGVRQLVRAGELVGYELVHVPSLVAFQRRLEDAAA
jgi:hypothetical protein